MSDVEPAVRTAPESDAPSEAAEGPEGSMFRDPAVRKMTYAALVVVILFLATAVGALVTGVISNTDGPRTAGERQLMIAAAVVNKPGATGEAWASYVDALVVTGDLGQAQVALDRARASAGASVTPDLDLAGARLLRAQERHEQAVEAADTAMKGYKAELAARTADGVLGDNYYNAVLVKARSCAELGRWKDAVEAFDIYITAHPTSADILVDRGNAKVGMKDNAGAEKDFRAALRFVPYDEEAKAGLKRIGVAE